MVYDGRCGFCLLWAARWRFLTQDRLLWSDFDRERARFPDLSASELESSVRLVTPSGAVHSGAEAVFMVLGEAPGGSRWLWAYRHIPGLAAFSQWAYRWIARRRGIAHKLTLWIWGDTPQRETYDLTRWLFLRLMGVIYFIAFASLSVQIIGLIGSDGILPAGAYLEALKAKYGREVYRWLPTLFWFASSDASLRLVCGMGIAFSTAVIIGILPGLSLLALWALYLSLVAAGQDFLSFQWDILLLEAGLLAVFWAPGRLLWLKPKTGAPSLAVLWLLRWLLFRLMFESGLVKLLSGDPTWRNLTALQYHYETQCIPTAIGWFAHQFPGWFQKVSVVGMFAAELIVPFMIFLPRRPRLAAFVILTGLQITIALTGNYGFFNLLTWALCLTLLDDAALYSFFRRKDGSHPPTPAPRWRAAMTLPLVLIVAIISVSQLYILLSRKTSFPESLKNAMSWVMPFHPVNSYGLFAVMTVKRPEIVIEGSMDNRLWLAYEFKWKAGDTSRRPPFVAPYQPRLDWQMWFAALGDYRNSPWFTYLLARILMDSRPVMKLFEKNPFPDAPPRYVRALLYEYRFTDFAARRGSGNWWKRELQGLYCPVLTRETEQPAGSGRPKR